MTTKEIIYRLPSYLCELTLWLLEGIGLFTCFIIGSVFYLMATPLLTIILIAILIFK